MFLHEIRCKDDANKNSKRYIGVFGKLKMLEEKYQSVETFSRKTRKVKQSY